MVILPYLHKITVVNNITVHSFTILTIGGTELWEEEYSKEILEENEIIVTSIVHKADICLCKVDSEKTKMDDFYKWEEITTSDTFCWRTFYTFGNEQNWLPHPNEYIGIYSYQDLCSIIST